MNKQFERQMVSKLNQVLFSRSVLKRVSLSKKALQALVKEEDYRSRFGTLLAREGRFSCAEVLALCRSTLDRLAPEPEEGWLLFSYRFARGLLFPDAELKERAKGFTNGAMFLLALLQVVFDYERTKVPFERHMDFQLLDEQALSGSDSGEEYRLLLARFRQDFIYELLRLGVEVTPYHTLEHIAGVHDLALSVARELKQTGALVDLPLVSGAALVHDLGKFGCKAGERVPYLHYHYTDHWCKGAGLPGIGHIAANHSTWDLELELLQVESLILIYADFRVREAPLSAWETGTQVLSLRQSFDAILSKLDQVDERKLKRYKAVYMKLHDFEDYMVYQGVDIQTFGALRQREKMPDPVLMSPHQAIEALKYLSIGHNIALMHRLGSERLFNNILEAARSEKQWKNVRAYINIFEEYFNYLTPPLKSQTLNFLYELLMHKEGDIRRAASGLMGKIIARFKRGYLKELPEGFVPDPYEPDAFSAWEKYLKMIILPDHKLSDQHKRWIGYTLKIIVGSLLEHCLEEEKPRYMGALMNYFSHPLSYELTTVFVLLDTMNSLPLDYFGEAELSRLAGFSIAATDLNSMELTVAALRVLRRVSEALTDETSSCYSRILHFAKSFSDDSVTLTFLKGRVLRALHQSDMQQQRSIAERSDVISDIFLDNLKTATPWVIKAINIKLLLDRIEQGEHERLLHIAAHLSNLIKVSERVAVRHDAGNALLKIAPLLSRDQRNEIAVELMKGLEVGQYEFSKYIPLYLGQFALWLRPSELDEFVRGMENLVSGMNEQVVSVSLGTVGVMLEHYPEYKARFSEEEGRAERRKEKLLGLLLKGLASHQVTVRQEAMLVLGQGLFGSARLSAAEKGPIFTLICKKMLFLFSESAEDELTSFYSAACLNHIYRFIAGQRMQKGALKFKVRDKVAFFPGTFDPFTLSHKGIAQEISDLGFEVMLAVDEFSWSKKMQPRLIRRLITSMSIADQFHVHIFPDSFPVNIANPQDLRRLKDAFPNRSLYIVVGSDVIMNASSYAASPEDDSIHTLNHIIFKRESGEGDTAEPQKAAIDSIKGDVIELSLPVHLEDISSSRIRDNIDHNRDISHLIDPFAQEYIYKNSLYLREPQYKSVMSLRPLRFERYGKERGYTGLQGQMKRLLNDEPTAELIWQQVVDKGLEVIVLQSGEHKPRLESMILYQQISSSSLYAELRDLSAVELVRRKASGRILRLSGLYSAVNSGADYAQLLLTEALSDALAEDCTYAIFHPIHPALALPPAIDVLKLQGFLKSEVQTLAPLYLVDMDAPMTLIQNLETTIKEPLASNGRVLDVIHKAHRNMQRAMCRLYPGSLVLSLSTSVIHQRLTEKIVELNGVPKEPQRPRKLGPYMCVPFGKIMRGKVVPNTVTKTLHTDKVYEPDILSQSIEPFPFYPPLKDQIKTIKSFMRPAILVDDLLHEGNRMLALNPLFLEEELPVHSVLVGLLSGLGRDLMEEKGRPVYGVYYIPNLRQWFVESTLYPFIGGDTVRRAAAGGPLVPAVNLILPYATPPLDEGADRDAIFDFSLTCLQNAQELLLALEGEYRAQFERNLTLNRLSEAVILPLCPDKGGCMHYDLNLAASVYVQNDIEMLMRTQNILKG